MTRTSLSQPAVYLVTNRTTKTLSSNHWSSAISVTVQRFDRCQTRPLAWKRRRHTNHIVVYQRRISGMAGRKSFVQPES